MKELNVQAYVSCLTLICASGSSFMAIHPGQEPVGGGWGGAQAETLTDVCCDMTEAARTTNSQKCISFNSHVLVGCLAILQHVSIILKNAVVPGGPCFAAVQRRRARLRDFDVSWQLQRTTDKLMIFF